MMIQRRAKAVGPHTKISFHSFRAAHTAKHFQNGVKSEIAQQGMNPHVPPSFAIAAATTVISHAQLGGSSPLPRSSCE
jgi:hypothetical protein